MLHLCRLANLQAIFITPVGRARELMNGGHLLYTILSFEDFYNQSWEEDFFLAVHNMAISLYSTQELRCVRTGDT